MHEFIFDGVSSSTFNAYVASSNFLDGASRDIKSVEIPGRSGNVILDNGRYNNFVMVVNVYIRKDITQNAQDLKAFLLAHCSKYYTFEDSFAPDVFRMARFTGEFVVETFDHQGGVFALEFDCMPQRFLKSGTVAQEITGGSGTISNPTFFESSPLLTVYGAGTIGINDDTITIRDDAYGEIQLTDAFTLSAGGSKTVSIEDLFNEGDYITFENGQVTVMIRCNTPVTSASVSFTGALEPATYALNAYGSLVTLSFTVPQSSQALSSSTTYQSVSFTVSADTGMGSGYASGYLQEYIYPASEEVVVRTGFSQQGGTVISTKTLSASMNGITGVSTVGGSWPFMVDLDSLKAYKDTGGQVVNLNHLVEFGTEAPTLKPGENEITSDTYPSDQLDIVPRWWTL